VSKQGAPNGLAVPEPGKPYAPTEAQRVKVPRGLRRKQEEEFWHRTFYNPESSNSLNSAGIETMVRIMGVTQ
jgi:hypothetical protein